MNPHRELERYLVEFCIHELEPTLLKEIGSHIETCPECREWLLSYRLIATALTDGSESPTTVHPNPKELVQLALTPSALDPQRKKALEAHLADCISCRNEERLCRNAISSAGAVPPWPGLLRQAKEGPRRKNRASHSNRPSGSGKPHRNLALHLGVAAVITLTILAGSLLLRGRHSPPKTVLLRGRILTGEQTIEATRRIELGQSRISSDASITLRAGTVALADGFSLDRGANLTIQAGNESQ